MGCRIVKDNRARIKTEVRARLQTIIADGAESAAEAARAAAPVASGALRDSIAVQEGEGMTRQVVVGVAYGPEVELGTTDRPAQPFLHSSLDQTVPGVKSEARKIVD